MKTVYFFTVEHEEKTGVAFVLKPLFGSSEILIVVGRHVFSVVIRDYLIGTSNVSVRWHSKSADGIGEYGEVSYIDDSEFADEVVDNIFRHTIVSVCASEGYCVDDEIICEPLRC